MSDLQQAQTVRHYQNQKVEDILESVRRAIAIGSGNLASAAPAGNVQSHPHASASPQVPSAVPSRPPVLREESTVPGDLRGSRSSFSPNESCVLETSRSGNTLPVDGPDLVASHVLQPVDGRGLVRDVPGASQVPGTQGASLSLGGAKGRVFGLKDRSVSGAGPAARSSHPEKIRHDIPRATPVAAAAAADSVSSESVVHIPRRPVNVPNGEHSQVLEEILSALLRPLLHDWMDRHMERVINQAVRDEIRSILRSARF